MIPRIDIVGVEEDSTVEEVSKIVEEAGHSRIPIYKETLDNIIGVIHAKALLWVTQKDKPIREVEELIRPPYFVPDTKNIYDLLRAFQRRKTHLAIVLDEYGGTAGLVTMEDIIEEIFGEIQDEYDTEEPHFKILDDNSIILDAIVSIEDAQDIVEVRFPEGEFETIGGFAFAMFGRIPREGETLQLDDLKVKMVMEKVEGHRISKIRIIKLPDKDNDGGKTKSETSKAEDGLR